MQDEENNSSDTAKGEGLQKQTTRTVISRRKFGLITVLGGLGFIYKVAKETWGIAADTQANLPFLQGLIGTTPIGEHVQAAAMQLFRLRSHHTSIVPAASNPAIRSRLLQYRGSPNTSTRDDLLKYFSVATVDAASSIAPLLLGSSADRFLDYRGAKKLLKANPFSNVLAIGTPTSNELIRLLMQYVEIEGGNAGHKFIPGDGLHFPVSFELRSAAVLSHHIERDRFYRGRSKDGLSSLIPNWGLNIPGQGVILPKTDGKGMLLEDFIVISCIPNWLHPEAIEREVPVVCIGGTHGVGTTAISNLLKNKVVLPQLQEELGRLGNPNFWQAVIRVELDGPGGKAAQLVLEREMIRPIGYHIPTLLKLHNSQT